MGALMVDDDRHDSNADATLFVRGLARGSSAVDSSRVAAQIRDLRAALTEYFHQMWEAGGSDDDLFAEAMGYSASLIAQLRRGAKNITVEHLAQLAVLQGVPVIVVLAHVVAMLGKRMGGPDVVEAPGSMLGGSVTPEFATRMRRASEALRARAPAPARGRKPPAPR